METDGREGEGEGEGHWTGHDVLRRANREINPIQTSPSAYIIDGSGYTIYKHSRLVGSDVCGLVIRLATNHTEIRPPQFRSPVDFQISTTFQKLGSCSTDRGLFKASAKQEPKREVNFFNFQLYQQTRHIITFITPSLLCKDVKKSYFNIYSNCAPSTCPFNEIYTTLLGLRFYQDSRKIPEIPEGVQVSITPGS
ncbi:hypothetical protein BOTCAL_0149g00170 [Botryotinia calthae]|uniref:Uncharacterized protein n=1 Tax=Botryotinia calthae TaxID=38488 RepID=A0A4Y8D2H5_9HELO|nr:hypothetical protein BOTCAL_0149g00170 [Botryotinia calthae]